MTRSSSARYRPTEAQYKGGGDEMYVTYDLEQRTRGGHAIYPKVKRVYIAGDVTGWQTGRMQKRTGRQVHGVRVEYEQRRQGYRRRGYSARRGATGYTVGETAVAPTAQHFTQIVEVPEHARNLHFYRAGSELPPRYREALQRIR
jgi:hypothetical protein